MTTVADVPDLVYVSFDIEKAGKMTIKHAVVSIGYCVGDAEGNVLEKNKINLKVGWPVIDDEGTVVDYNAFEKRCWDEFWSKQPESLINNLKENAVPQTEGFLRFSDFLDQLETKYKKVVFLSDNAEFDIGSLNVGLEIYCGRGPLRYTSAGKYRSIMPPDDLLESLDSNLQTKLVEKYITPYVVHDHDPSNDAEYIYRQYVAYLHRL